MTQAFNLSQFANKLNTSGQTSNAGLQNSSVTVNTTSPLAGGGAVALGSALTLTHANSGVTANTYTAATITVNAQGHVTAASSNTIGAGTVTSVATGNGLSGGTITSTGTLVVACPAANTVGSYCSGAMSGYAVSGAYVNFTVNFGSNYAAGSGNQQMQCASVGSTNDAENPDFKIPQSLSLSGTWKWLGANTQVSQAFAWSGTFMAVACRVS